ncbi:MAG: FHA domain-containing protein [Cyanobacteria bacterium]|nr:FHA domain-containing protein [Cyanobacteriota bacterium]MDW8202643.1 FHA domain-containing protein [Cyanobacteriota bacterium SKYGB_h_bin112]
MTSQPPSPNRDHVSEPDSLSESDFVFIDDPLQISTNTPPQLIEDTKLPMSDSYGDDNPLPESSRAVMEILQVDSSQPDSDLMDTEIGDDSVPHRETMRIPDAFQGQAAVTSPAVTQLASYYIQGVVQGVHAYLITNLMGGESETLLQPQMVWTIGRNRQVAILLKDSGLSRRHAVIQYVTRQGFYLVDLGSMNGSFVNGLRIKQRHLLEDGDRVSMGNTSFTFYTSCRNRTLETIHPEVLIYLNNASSLPVSAMPK